MKKLFVEKRGKGLCGTPLPKLSLCSPPPTPALSYPIPLSTGNLFLPDSSRYLFLKPRFEITELNCGKIDRKHSTCFLIFFVWQLKVVRMSAA